MAKGCTGQGPERDELGIDLQSLSFFVKQDLRTEVRALFKTPYSHAYLLIHVHFYPVLSNFFAAFFLTSTFFLSFLVILF